MSLNTLQLIGGGHEAIADSGTSGFQGGVAIAYLHKLKRSCLKRPNHAISSLVGTGLSKETLDDEMKPRQNRLSSPILPKGVEEMRQKRETRQVRTTLHGIRLAEFDALVEQLGLNASSVLRLALRRLALTELQSQAASLNESKEAA